MDNRSCGHQWMEWSDRLGEAYRWMSLWFKTGLSQVCSLHSCLLVLLQRYGWWWNPWHLWDHVWTEAKRISSLLSYQLVSWDFSNCQEGTCPPFRHVWWDCSKWWREDGETESGDLSAPIESLSPQGFGEHFHWW